VFYEIAISLIVSAKPDTNWLFKFKLVAIRTRVVFAASKFSPLKRSFMTVESDGASGFKLTVVDDPI
jgi:hypothetical protein